MLIIHQGDPDCKLLFLMNWIKVNCTFIGDSTSQFSVYRIHLLISWILLCVKLCGAAISV